MSKKTRVNINRREFLKLAGVGALSYAAPASLFKVQQQADAQQNVLIVVFDAWSALHCSLYGYGRDTTPNINRLAERATVYHNHYAGGKFTVPGTASLLSGVLPWQHKAYGLGAREMAQAYLKNNFFSHFDNHHRFAYSHNPLADGILTTLIDHIDDLTPRTQLYLENDQLINLLFNRDNDTANVAWSRAFDQAEEIYDFGYSLFLTDLYEKITASQASSISADFPQGVPAVRRNETFLLEDAIQWLHVVAKNSANPFLGYYHFWPPHFPYHTHKDFAGRFENDGFVVADKPRHLFHENKTDAELKQFRLDYDETVLYVDAEFAKLYDLLQASGVLENTWLVLTSDHGEMFERGVQGHSGAVLAEPVLRIPLLIFEPGQTVRQDIYEPTSALDLLPTFSHLTGQALPDWGAGQILPPFGPAAAQPRDIFLLDSRTSEPGRPMTEGSVMLRRGAYKLHYYFGYAQLAGAELVELYDIENDREELHDLSVAMPELVAEMKQIILARLAQFNQPD